MVKVVYLAQKCAGRKLVDVIKEAQQIVSTIRRLSNIAVFSPMLHTGDYDLAVKPEFEDYLEWDATLLTALIRGTPNKEFELWATSDWGNSVGCLYEISLANLYGVQCYELNPADFNEKSEHVMVKADTITSHNIEATIDMLSQEDCKRFLERWGRFLVRFLNDQEKVRDWIDRRKN